MESHTPYYLAFQKLGVGYQTLSTLLKHFPSVEVLWNASDEALRATGVSDTFIASFTAKRKTIDPEEYARSVQRPDVTILPIIERCYPMLLRETHSPPLVLFVHGNIESLSGHCLTVVGTRKPTAYGLGATRTIVEPLARAGITIVSGLAYGIDAAAHAAALDAGGTTIAVLGSGIDRVYPRVHQDLAERMTKQGAIVSEHPPGTEPQRHFFPQRNRIIAGLSAATVIVEAGLKSGALITARMALEENREVFAVPGPINAETSAGPNNLIKTGAGVVTSADDLRDVLGLDIRHAVPDNSEIHADSAAEAALLPLLKEPRHIDELTTISKLETSVVNATLSMLEMKGRVRHLGGMHYVIT